MYFWGRHNIFKCLRLAFKRICYEVWTKKLWDSRYLTPSWFNFRINCRSTESFISKWCFMCSFPRSLVFFPFIRKDALKEYGISGFHNHVYMNIRYFWFVYQKSIGTVIQGIAYETQSIIFYPNLFFLGSGANTFARRADILK